jgi:hypothetical protein
VTQSTTMNNYFIVNARARTSLAVLHEYAQKVLKVCRVFVFQLSCIFQTNINFQTDESRNSLNPYVVSVRLSTSGDVNILDETSNSINK